MAAIELPTAPTGQMGVQQTVAREFSQQTTGADRLAADIQTAWQNAVSVRKGNPDKWRQDGCGAWICRDHYGDHNSPFGWEIVPAASAEPSAGAAALPSLRPFQWKNAAAIRDGKRAGPVMAQGGQNIDFS